MTNRLHRDKNPGVRYAIVSDIHANRQAWDVVLLDIRSSRVDSVICLGDIIGYGPAPAGVLESVYTNVDHFILGNHEAVICGKLDASLFNANARKLIAWTRGRLDRKAVDFFRTLPLSLDGGGFRCAHSDFGEPAAFHYVIDAEDALPSWATVDDRLLFVGHTHDTSLHLLGNSGSPHRVPPQDFVIEDGKRYLVNVGSVGQPRDGDARASYCIYDDEAQSVYFRRIPFDLDAYRAAVVDAGLDPQSSPVLRVDPRRGVPPIRQQLSFSPAATPEQAVQDAVEVQDLHVLQKRVSRWRGLALGVAVLSASAALAGGFFWFRHATRKLVLAAHDNAPLHVVARGADQNLLTLPAAAPLPGKPVPGWNIVLGHRRKQSCTFGRAGEAAVFSLASSSARAPIRLMAQPVRASPGDRMRMAAVFQKSDDFRGSIVLVLSAWTSDGQVIDQLAVKEPTWKLSDGDRAQKTIRSLPPDTTAVQYSIRGAFTGTVTVRDMELLANP